MKTSLVYGFLLALAGFLVSLVLYVLGFHSSPEKLQAVNWPVTALLTVICVALLALGMRAKRDATPADKSWGYGSALGTGVMIALFSALFSLVFTYVYFAFINPNMSDLIYQVQVAKMEARGMSADQIEKAEGMMRKMIGPVPSSIFGSVMGFIWGFLLSLIVAIFFRNRSSADVPPAVAAV